MKPTLYLSQQFDQNVFETHRWYVHKYTPERKLNNDNELHGRAAKQLADKPLPESAILPYFYKEKTSRLENPDSIESIHVTLPSGLTARFVRLTDWTEKSSKPAVPEHKS